MKNKTRKIKFRVWDKYNKEMLGVENLDFEYGELSIRTDMYNDYYSPKDMILMQYIGLKDINGKEIYEGDIVELIFEEDGETLTGKGIVKYLDDWTGFFCVSFDGNCTSSILNPRVIGNIYENKELLEVK